MSGPLVDTSVLVEFYLDRPSPEADVLEALLSDGPDPAIAPIVAQEFLQGLSRPSDLARGRDYLQRFIQLAPPGYAIHERAAALHRGLRQKGFAAGTVDALIVAMAEAAGLPLLTADALQVRLCREAGVPAL